MASKLKWFHLCMVGVWLLLGIPTVLWWKESILWVAIMSIWANVAGHFGAYDAARGEEKQEESGG